MAMAQFCPAPWLFPHNWPHLHDVTPNHIWPNFARHVFDQGPCCEFCEAWSIRQLPTLAEAIFTLNNPLFNVVSQEFDRIHGHFMLGYDRNENSYYLSRELDKLSWLLWDIYLFLPGYPELRKLSRKLKAMGREMQVGRQRLRYYVMPKPFTGIGYPHF